MTKRLAERLKDVKKDPDKYGTELTGLWYAAGALAILLLLEAISYLGFLRTIPGFLANYGWWLLYLDLTVVAIGFSLWHFAAYKLKVTCMTGMMVGMGFGMQTGMLLGAILGATNGFFLGALIGMVLAVSLGVWTGRCCGTMGILQGAMAGVMGGTMGPMITLMMFNDHLLWFMPFYVLINLLIMVGTSLMLFEESVEGKEVERNPMDFLTFVSACVIVTAALIGFMLLAPHSVFLG